MEDRQSQFQRIEQIAIVGTGLIGGSIGLGLKAAGFKGKILGLGRRMETLQRAKDRGCVDEITLSISPGIKKSQLVILATPIGTFEEWFTKLLPECHKGIVITDVGSTKGNVCDMATRRLAGYARRFVGAHPLAGGEQQGPEYASADLFRGRPCILTPLGATDSEAVMVVETLWGTLGMKLVSMLPRDHDWTVARISHLPHALAAALVDYVHHAGGMEIASTGFRDTTRVASGDPKLWIDIFATNREAILEAIEQYVQEVTVFRDLLAKKNDKKLLDFLTRAQKARDGWVKSSGIQIKDDQSSE